MIETAPIPIGAGRSLDRLETQLLDRDRVMFIFDVGESTLDEWQKKRLLPCFRVGRVVRFEPEAVFQFILRHTLRARGATTGPQTTGLPDKDWERIERFLAETVESKLRKIGYVAA